MSAENGMFPAETGGWNLCCRWPRLYQLTDSAKLITDHLVLKKIDICSKQKVNQLNKGEIYSDIQ